MSEHVATVEWSRGDQAFGDHRYSRVHDWRFDGGAVVRGSPALSAVPEPMSDPTAVDPEEALVAAVSSCHMLFFLSIACKAGFVVESYRDDAVGLLEPDARGRSSITKVTLKPVVAFLGAAPDLDTFQALHHQAHEICYVANSIRSEIVLEPSLG
ncbi:MAG TPA: OsmC family protein [Brevundimonas sp.]|nr:OsmC family protein [Brevundimonas sp.]